MTLSQIYKEGVEEFDKEFPFGVCHYSQQYTQTPDEKVKSFIHSLIIKLLEVEREEIGEDVWMPKREEYSENQVYWEAQRQQAGINGERQRNRQRIEAELEEIKKL